MLRTARTADTVEVLSLGMGQLQLPDLLMVAPAGQGNEALSFALDLLGIIISEGRPIPEGHTVGRSETERQPVTHVAPPINPAQRVMRVAMARRKQGWWPFGRR